MGLPWWLSNKEVTSNAGQTGNVSSIPGSGSSLRGGNGNMLQYSCLENPMDRVAWQNTVHGVAKSWTWLKWLSTRTHTHTHTREGLYVIVCFVLEQEVATHFIITAWEIPWTKESGGLQSMESQKRGAQDLATELVLCFSNSWKSHFSFLSIHYSTRAELQPKVPLDN